MRILANILVIIAIFCAFQAEANDKFMNVLRVTDFEFTLNDKPAVSIAFGESDSNYCDATILRSLVRQGYKASSTKRSDTSFSIDCHWDSDYFVESSNHKTFSNLSIKSIDKRKKTALIEISLRFVGLPSNKYIEFDKIQVFVSGDQFKNLITP